MTFSPSPLSCLSLSKAQLTDGTQKLRAWRFTIFLIPGVLECCCSGRGTINELLAC